MTDQLKALQNFGDTLGLTIHEKPEQDRRRKLKKYFATKDGVSVSPCLDYSSLNGFMLGWLAALSNKSKT